MQLNQTYAFHHSNSMLSVRIPPSQDKPCGKGDAIPFLSSISGRTALPFRLRHLRNACAIPIAAVQIKDGAVWLGAGPRTPFL